MFGINIYVILSIIMLIIIGGAAFYVKISSDTIRELRDKVTVLDLQSKSLQAANDFMQADVKNIQEAQRQTNQKLDTIRLASAQLTRTILSRKFDTSHIKELQQQINKDTTSALQQLEALSRDP